MIGSLIQGSPGDFVQGEYHFMINSERSDLAQDKYHLLIHSKRRKSQIIFDWQLNSGIAWRTEIAGDFVQGEYHFVINSEPSDLVQGEYHLVIHSKRRKSQIIFDWQHAWFRDCLVHRDCLAAEFRDCLARRDCLAHRDCLAATLGPFFAHGWHCTQKLRGG